MARLRTELLAKDAGCEPISQVMGSSSYHVGQIPDYKGKTYYFCSDDCKARFTKEPAKYAK